MSKLEEFARQYEGLSPIVLLDIDKVEENFNKMKNGSPKAKIHYAVKANPNRHILEKLKSLGSYFDAASIGEIDLLMELGISADKISYGNTIKKKKDIKYAFEKGIRLYAVDSKDEIEKISEVAPNSNVFIRLIVKSTEAEWPLSRKFGCSEDMFFDLLELSRNKKLNPVGLSFHIGSQTKHPYMWEKTLKDISLLWKKAKDLGFNLNLLNAGGGFPSYYGVKITDLKEYCSVLENMIFDMFDGVDYLMIEPGRGLVADAGMIVSEAVLVSKKDDNEDHRWVYLDIGKFSGLSETIEEAIKYEFIVPGKEHDEVDKCIVAGPTCDSADILYEKNKINFPITLKSGDKILIKNTGAYTTTYSSVWFNGFEPLREMVI